MAESVNGWSLSKQKMLKEKLVMQSKNFSNGKMLTGDSLSVTDINTIFRKYLTLAIIHFLCATLVFYFLTSICVWETAKTSHVLHLLRVNKH